MSVYRRIARNNWRGPKILIALMVPCHARKVKLEVFTFDTADSSCIWEITHSGKQNFPRIHHRAFTTCRLNVTCSAASPTGFPTTSLHALCPPERYTFGIECNCVLSIGVYWLFVGELNGVGLFISTKSSLLPAWFPTKLASKSHAHGSEGSVARTESHSWLLPERTILLAMGYWPSTSWDHLLRDEGNHAASKRDQPLYCLAWQVEPHYQLGEVTSLSSWAVGTIYIYLNNVNSYNSNNCPMMNLHPHTNPSLLMISF